VFLILNIIELRRLRLCIIGLCLWYVFLQALESKLASCRTIDRSHISSFHECTSPTQSTPK